MNKSKSLYHLFLLIALVVLGLYSSAQQTPSLFLYSSDSSFRESSSMIWISGNGLTGSNSLNNQYVKKSIFGGHLDATHLTSLYDKMKSQNRAGFLANGSIELYNFSDSLFHREDIGLHASFSTNYHGYLSFNRDLFKTVYIGNKSFAGQEVELGPVIGGYQAWQKFGVGIFNKKTWSSATLSLVAGQHYESLIANDAKLYTSPIGDSLSLSYMGDYLRSDSIRKGFANGSGLGLAIDLNYNIPLEDNSGFISISVQDIGFIAWSKLSQKFRYDSLSTWAGFEIDNLFQPDSGSFALPRLRDTLNYNQETKAFTSALPASVHLRYSRIFSGKYIYEAGISLWPNRAAIPLIYAGASQFLRENLLISERVTYGGYGKLGIGAELQWMPRNTWFIKAGSSNLEGFVSGKSVSMSAYFALAKFFGRVNNDSLPDEL